MITLKKRVVIDEQGNPTDVIIPWDQFKRLEELPGLDLDDRAEEDLRQAAKDRQEGNLDAYIDINEI